MTYTLYDLGDNFMSFIDFLVFAIAVLFSGVVSVPFSALVARKRPLLVFLLPLLLAIISLISYIVFWKSNHSNKDVFNMIGLYATLASIGSIFGSLYIIVIRRYYRI